MVSSRKDAKAQRTPLDIKENKIAKQVVDAAYQIHSKIGPGLFESVLGLLITYNRLSVFASLRGKIHRKGD